MSSLVSPEQQRSDLGVFVDFWSNLQTFALLARLSEYSENA